MKSFLVLVWGLFLAEGNFHFLKKAILLERHTVPNATVVEYQDLRYEVGEKFSYYISMDVNSSNYGFNFTVGQCGKIILDVPMVENVFN
jgi:hypothetical protein